MEVRGTGSGHVSRQEPIQTPTDVAGSRPGTPVDGLQGRVSPSGSTPPRTSSLTPPPTQHAGQSVELAANLREFNRLLYEEGGMALLQQGVNGGFHTLEPRARGHAEQMARISGLTPQSMPDEPLVSFPQFEARLDTAISDSKKLVTTIQASLASHQATVGPRLNRLKNDVMETAAGIAQMDVKVLSANKEAVKTKIQAWSDSIDAVRDQLATLHDGHPLKIAAQQASTEASAVFFNTMVRMAKDHYGTLAYDLTIGRMLAGYNFLFGPKN